MATSSFDPRCPTCDALAAPGAHFCPGCGTDLLAGTPTMAVPSSDASAAARLPTMGVLSPSAGAATPLPTSATPFASSSTTAGPALAPGTIFAGRYRIVALLGEGGMGVVYRADDLKLGQTVALKLLPEQFAREPDRLAAFLAEVRNARVVSHPNVCRVFDIAEHDGLQFLSMEYVDGETLASLLRRIGRLPVQKALEVAQQLCAGLAAAHALGVVHRDLKPANVMLDGHGRARITDFGLALGPRDSARAGELAGTPWYMAPEQLAGSPAGVRTDLWSLGLVLYELFTGRRGFGGATLSEIQKNQARGLKPPSHYAPDLDPQVEAAILSCLDNDPAKRPGSALELAAALPGGSPLAVAIAAGETPSPEMVAAEQHGKLLAHAGAWRLGAAAALAVAVAVALASRLTLVGMGRPAKSPEVLADRARTIAVAAGFTREPRDAAFWYEPEVSGLAAAASGREPPSHLIAFAYRESSHALVPRNLQKGITESDPPLDAPGMLLVHLSTGGTLERLEAVPAASAAAETEPDWSPLFAAAGLDRSGFHQSPVPAQRPRAADVVRAWQDGSGHTVVAASYHGQPVLFDAVVGIHEAEGSGGLAATVLGWLWVLFFFGSVAASAVLGVSHLRSRRADTRGALRIASAGAILSLATALLPAHRAWATPDDVFTWLRTSTASAVWLGLLMWLFYVSLEPFVRRQSPGLLVGWMRLLGGRLHDPLVGRDVLRGTLAGATGACALFAGWAAVNALGGTPQAPMGGSLTPLLGPTPAIGAIAQQALVALFAPLLLTMALALGRHFTGGHGTGVPVMVALALLLGSRGADAWTGPGHVALRAVVFAALLTATLLWSGLLATTAACLTFTILRSLPVGAGLSGWTLPTAALPLLVLAAIIGWGVVASRPQTGG